MQNINLAELSDADLAALASMCIDEQSRRSVKAQAAEAAKAAAEQFSEAVQGESAIKVSDIPAEDAIGPGQRIIDVDGAEWENTSSTWLSPHVAGPGTYSLGWTRVGGDAVDANTIPVWDPNGHEYKAGDQVSYNGVAYTVVQDHESQAGWTPDVVAALYTVA